MATLIARYCLCKQDFMLGVVIAFANVMNMIGCRFFFGGKGGGGGAPPATFTDYYEKIKIWSGTRWAVLYNHNHDVVGILAFLGPLTLFWINGSAQTKPYSTHRRVHKHRRSSILLSQVKINILWGVLSDVDIIIQLRL